MTARLLGPQGAGRTGKRSAFFTVLACLSPAIAMLVGAGIGFAIHAGESAPALGAIVGFLIALGIARLAIALLPGQTSSPQLISLSNQSRTFRQE